MINHPLFPADDAKGDGPDGPDVVNIRIGREDAPNQWVACPQAFAAEDLTSWDQVWRAFGGGHYQLTARGGDGRVLRGIKERLAGPSRPLVPPQPVEEKPPAAPVPMGGTSELLTIMMAMLNGAKEDSRSFNLSVQANAASLVTSVQSMAQSTMQAMAQMVQADKQSTAVLIAKLLEREGAGGQQNEALFDRGISLGKELGKRDRPGKPDAIESLAGGVVQGLMMIQQMKEGSPNAQTTNGTAPPAPVAPTPPAIAPPTNGNGAF
jgi:hypothetical protein